LIANLHIDGMSLSKTTQRRPGDHEFNRDRQTDQVIELLRKFMYVLDRVDIDY